MVQSVTCPCCGKYASVVDWSQNCECSHCGSEFNQLDRERRERAARRVEFERETGIVPVKMPKQQYV